MLSERVHLSNAWWHAQDSPVRYPSFLARVPYDKTYAHTDPDTDTHTRARAHAHTRTHAQGQGPGRLDGQLSVDRLELGVHARLVSTPSTRQYIEYR